MTNVTDSNGAHRREIFAREGLPLPSLAALDRPELLRETAVRLAVKRFRAERAARPWLLLLGPPGCGKTLSAAEEVIAAHAEDGRAVFGAVAWTSWADLLSLDIWAGKIRELAEARVLTVIDDVGQKGAGKLEACTLPRYDRMRPTIFTSNLSVTAFEEAHPRIFDRLHEVGRIVEVGAPSLRREAGK